MKQLLFKMNRFYLWNRFRIVNNETTSINKIRAGLSYHIVWGTCILLFFLLLLYIFHEVDYFFPILFLIFSIVHGIGVFVILRYKAWKAPIHFYCILVLAAFYFEINYNTEAVDTDFMLYTIVVLLLSFTLLGNVFGTLYSLIAIFLIFMLLNQRLDGIVSTIASLNGFFAIYNTLVFFFITYVCYHYMKSLYSSVGKMQKASLRQEKLSLKLIETTDAANESAKIKEDFLSTMSHELRSPLNSVIGFAKLLQEEILDQNQKENLQLLLLSAENLIKLINDVLDFNKIDNGNLIFEKTQINFFEMFVWPESSFLMKIKNENINLKVVVDQELRNVYFQDDIIRFQQIIYNIICNINQHIEDQEVLFTIQVLKVDHNDFYKFQLEISFKAYHEIMTYLNPELNVEEALFEHTIGESLSFLRIAIAKKIANQRGEYFTYRYFAASNRSSVSFNVYIKKINPNTLISGTKINVLNYENFHVLVVDDNELNAFLITKLLQKYKMKVESVTDGEAAIQKVKNSHFDLVLMDINMPVLNGFETAEMIRNYQKFIKILALSGEQKENICVKLKAAQIDGFVAKPVETNCLISEINRVMVATVSYND